MKSYLNIAPNWIKLNSNSSVNNENETDLYLNIETGEISYGIVI